MGGYRQLPVTPYNPPQEQSPLAMLAGIQQIKNQQQQGTALGLENQQRQLDIQNRQAGVAAMKEWDGKDITALPDLLAKHGADLPTVMNARTGIVKYQTDLAALSKDQLANEKTKNDYFAQAIDNVKSLPPEQQPQAFQAAVADAVQKGHLDPKQAATIQYQGPDQLDILEKSLIGHSAAVEQQLKTQQGAEATARAGEATANTAKTNAEMEFYKKNGGAPGVPLDRAEAADWLTKNPGKSLADYMKYKATLVPQFNFNLQGNTGAGLPTAQVAQRFGMTPDAFDQQAEKYWTTGQLPQVGRGTSGPALQRALMNRAAELHPEGSLAANTAEFKANEQALSKLQTNFDQVSAFENTAIKNLDQVAQAGKAIPDLSARFANVPVRKISADMIGTPEMARFKTALLTAQTEAAKVLSSANANGVLSDSARHEAQDVLDGNLPFPAMMASINQLKTDFGNRHQSYSDQIADIKKRMGNTGTSQAGGKEIHYKIVGGKLVPQ